MGQLNLPLLPICSVLSDLDDPYVKVHHEGVDLAGLPVLPQPSRDVEQDRLGGVMVRDLPFFLFFFGGGGGGGFSLCFGG